MYVIVERLWKIGVIEEFEKFWKKYVKALWPEDLRIILENKKKKISESLESLDENEENLKKIENIFSVKPTVHIYEWIEEVTKLYYKISKQHDYYYTIFNPQVLNKYIPDSLNIFADTVKNRGVEVKELLIEWNISSSYLNKYESKNHKIKILPKDINFLTDTILCEDEIYMISYEKNHIVWTQIINKLLSQTQKQLFIELWKKY